MHATFYIIFICLFLESYDGKGHGDLYKAPTKKERRKQKAKRRERLDQVFSSSI